VDSLTGETARGDYAGGIPGVVRPLLKWSTEYSAETDSSLATSGVPNQAISLAER
jgi:hypothetical protein